MSSEPESRRLLHLFGPGVVRPLHALPAPPAASRPSATGDDPSAAAIAPTARVRGTLAVTRAFGDYDIKLSVPDPAGGRMLRDGAMLSPQDTWGTPLGDTEPLMSPLVVGNVPEVHTYRRGAPAPAGGARPRAEDAPEPYDLLVAGCDGVWELESIAQIAERADNALQPLLHARWRAGVTTEVWWHTLEAAMHAVITETLQNAIAMSCTPDGKAPGGDNVSLLLTLLL
ncbi:hypothetical protein STCU_10641 [Strigomonas culicis]|uniref:PPM-type phosphatase domain-containing protein n=1 Tax=Strigomonas culicis TaxID=28005 RepID=S9US20_9TRYP|nr:hypothetical protein STCU_10641 [Strigomonas culicis]|eukprot:EPY17401.1 hypothetical protein STCU_10641 [Strigomonas culicis]